MLYIIYGDYEGDNYIRNPKNLFDGSYEYEWLEDEFVKEMVLDIDKSTIISPRLIDSPVLGPIGPHDIAGGTKTCILMKFLDGKVFNISGCGDNCSKWIIKISQEKDLTVRLGYLMNFGDEPFDAILVNTGEEIHNNSDFVCKVVEMRCHNDR